MYPHEVQATMAKIIFFIFATLMVCFSRANAFEVPSYQSAPVVINHISK